MEMVFGEKVEKMWHILDDSIDEELNERIRVQVLDWIATHGVDPDRHFDSRSKSFFFASLNNSILLRDLLKSPALQSVISNKLSDPVVQHAYPLIKPPSGPATTFHQDRAFWHKFDNPASMFTLWCAITDVTLENGCLRMAGGEQYEAHTVIQLRHGKTLELPVQPREAEDVPMAAGQVVYFDSFQRHGARENRSMHYRIGLKLVLAERSSLKRGFYYDIGDLGTRRLLFSNAVREAVTVARHRVKQAIKRQSTLQM